MKAFALPLPRSLRRLARDQRGVSAVEFAMLAPFMIALYLGCVEISDLVSCDRKVTLTAAALANLSAQVTTIDTAGMTNILNASNKIIAPYSSSNLHLRVSCLKLDETGAATVKWGEARNDTARSAGTPYIFDDANAALKVPGTYLLLAEVSYTYVPTIGNSLTGTMTLADKMFMSPRITAPSYGTTVCT